MTASSPDSPEVPAPHVLVTRGVARGAVALAALAVALPVAGAVAAALTLRPDATLTIGLASGAPAALAIVIAVAAIRRQLAAPLGALAEGYARLAAGDVAWAGPDPARGDEIGALARAHAALRRLLGEHAAAAAAAHAREAALAAERARAEADRAAADRRKGEAIAAMVDEVESETDVAVSDLIELMDQMTQITAEMSHAADRLGRTTGGVTAGSREALGAMRSAASSTRELTGSMVGVADQVRDAKATSDEAVAATRAASAAIAALSNVAAEIDDITGLIAHVARQTGLLAINAGVEAARAGGEGLGFALIAREVRSLADQSSGATGRIGRLIAEVQGSTRDAVSAVDSIAKAIDRVSGASELIATAIQGQLETSRVIAGDVEGAAVAVTGVADRLEGVAAEVQGSHEMATIVENACSEAAERLRALQGNLVRIVRTSPAGADRRSHERFEIDAIGAIDIRGETTPIRIVDLSEGGAKLIGAVEADSQAFILHAPGIDMPLRARVVRRQDDAVHVMFDIPDEGRARLRALIAKAARAGAQARAAA